MQRDGERVWTVGFVIHQELAGSQRRAEWLVERCAGKQE